MGVLNVTPDSFSDGGAYVERDVALEHARRLVAQGADMIDVGGESTRPGAKRVSPAEEQRRVLPVIEALAADGITVSIDTVHAETARLAVAAGASIINDVSGGTADSAMLAVAAETGATLVLMHWRGIPDPGHGRSDYLDVVEEVRGELAALASAALAAGVARERIVLDPGLGFDKTAEQGWQLLGGLGRLASLGYPLLIGVSRKRMLGETLAARRRDTGASPDSRGRLDAQGAAPEPAPRERDLATSVVSALSARAGAWAVRVHDVAGTVDALAIADAWSAGETQAEAEAQSVPEAQVVLDARACGEAPADLITLTGLEVFAHHGVFDFERAEGQRFVIDAEVTVDMRGAAANDDLARTVNYAELAGAILADAQTQPVDLIETLAERLAAVALGFAGVTIARITVHKPDAPIDASFADVSVTVRRTKRVQP